MKGPIGEILTYLVIDKYNLQGTVGLFQKISKFSPPQPTKGLEFSGGGDRSVRPKYLKKCICCS